LTDEPSLKTKTDVLDLIINFLAEHEKQMDQMLERLESVTEILSTRPNHIEHAPAPNHPTGLQPQAFTITITNPDSLEQLKSLKMEWGAKRGDVADVDPDAGSIVRKFERSIGKD